MRDGLCQLKKKTAKTNAAINHLADLGVTLGLGEALREFYFARPRQFRADLAWPEHRILLEVEGGIYIGGRHNRALGYQADCYKYSLASILGYTLIRVTYDMIAGGIADQLLTLAAERKK